MEDVFRKSRRRVWLQRGEQHWRRAKGKEAFAQLRRLQSLGHARSRAQAYRSKHVLRSALDRWRGAHDVARTRRERAASARARRDRAKLRNAFKAMAELPGLREAQLVVADHFFRDKVLRRQKFFWLSRLYAHCREQQRTRLEEHFASIHHRRRGVAQGLAKLREWAARSRVQKAVEMRAAAHARAALQQRCFHRWVLFHSWWNRTKAQLVRATCHFHQALNRRAFTAWLTWLVDRRSKHALADRAVRWRRDRLLRIGVVAWMENASSVLASRINELQSREAAKAARITKRVAHIASHWRNLLSNAGFSDSNSSRSWRTRHKLSAIVSACTALRLKLNFRSKVRMLWTG
jgi:hypothetical protein